MRCAPALLHRLPADVAAPGRAAHRCRDPRRPCRRRAPSRPRGARVVYFPSCLVADDGPAARRGRRRRPPQAMADVLRRGRASTSSTRTASRTSAAACRSRARPSPRRGRALRAGTGRGAVDGVARGRRPRRHRRLALRGHAQRAGRGVARAETGRARCASTTSRRSGRATSCRALDGRRRRPGPRGAASDLHAREARRRCPTCSRVARAHAEEVVVPRGAECCGFAGDRGFVVPELTRGATAREAAEVRAADGGARRRPLLDLPHLRDRHVARGGPARTRRSSTSCARPCSVVEPFLQWVAAAPAAAPSTSVLVALSALENVFPPVPADIAVVLGAFLGRQGIVSAPLLGVLCWLGQHGVVRGRCTSTRGAHGRRFFATRLAAQAHAAGGDRRPGEGLRAPRRLRHLRQPLPARGARGGDAVRGRGRDVARAGAASRPPSPPRSGTRSSSTAGSVLAQSWPRAQALLADANRALAIVDGLDGRPSWSSCGGGRAAAARRNDGGALPLVYVFHVAFYALFVIRKLGQRAPAPAAAPAAGARRGRAFGPARARAHRDAHGCVFGALLRPGPGRALPTGIAVSLCRRSQCWAER